jgi:hypothetical protein
MTALLPPNVKVHLALGFIRMRKGINGLTMLVQGVHRPSIRVPWSHPGQLDQEHLVGRHRLLSVHQMARAWCFLVVTERQNGRNAVTDLGPVVATD